MQAQSETTPQPQGAGCKATGSRVQGHREPGARPQGTGCKATQRRAQGVQGADGGFLGGLHTTDCGAFQKAYNPAI